ncbi:uncharacterized protein METZ01_LOCUS354929 [marine metagenome]|uniref:IspG C-terminal domain-containing protein n=1 Tax=marine metagenome TaxID=408172 RepID=A0A382RY36_9ZZZZ
MAIYPELDAKEYLANSHNHPKLNFIYATLPDLSADLLLKLKCDTTAVLLIDTNNEHGMAEQRRLFMELMTTNCLVPVIIGRYYESLTPECLRLEAATDIGALLIDGLGDGIFIAKEDCSALEKVNHTAFGILQASRTRISKTEYISCPSCGRTLFDLQEITAIVRERTSHLKGVKIGIMGCIVNGPGEMADADYGYVGTGVGQISLYRGQEVVQSNLPMEDAVDALIDLMKEDGVWVDTQTLEAVI